MPAGHVHRGILARELFRQALLIAARDELGLATRDAWLGDTLPEQGDDVPLDIGAGPGERTLIEYLRGFYPVQEVIARDWHQSKGPLDYVALAADREKASRTTLVKLLKKAGFEGKPNTRKADAAVPEAVDRLLAQMTFTSQFDAVRRLHAAIRADGESPARLGALARGYANLGVLTEVYWHPAHKGFKARAMLYARRMAAAEEKASPQALWHRAYVFALVGLHKQALADLEAAEKAWKQGGEKDEKKRPGWVDLLGPFCRYELEKLAPDQAPEADRELAWLLRFLATEQFGFLPSEFYQQHIIQAGMEAARAMPECYRVLDPLARWTGVGLGNSTTVGGMATMAEHLYGRVAAMQGLPDAPRLVCAAQGAGGGPLGALLGRREQTSLPEEFKARGQLMRALAAVGKPSIDRGEPSWAVLGMVIQEASFLQVYRRARFERRNLDVSPDEFLQAAAPLVAGHRFRMALDGFAWDTRQRRETLRKLSRMPLEGLEGHGQSLVDQFYKLYEPEWRAQVDLAGQRADGVARDLTVRLPLVPDVEVPETARRLEAVSPHCPAARAARIMWDWQNVAGQAAPWEKEAAHRLPVLVALGRRYAALNRPGDAERCLRAAAKLAPEAEIYKMLAEIFRKQGDEKKWLATLEEFLKQPEYDLSQARMREEIARYFMRHRQFDKALPYAEAAAETYSAWGLLCAGECHEAMRH